GLIWVGHPSLFFLVCQISYLFLSFSLFLSYGPLPLTPTYRPSQPFYFPLPTPFPLLPFFHISSSPLCRSRLWVIDYGC
ncbi:hypothetical protein F8388_021208, partial [Cannabis sativa]